VSLLTGLLFTALAIAYIVGAYADVRLDPRYVFPLVLVSLGVAGLAGSVLAQRRSDRGVREAGSTPPEIS
jgi:predicted MFS family arabinose efflux permease